MDTTVIVSLINRHIVSTKGTLVVLIRGPTNVSYTFDHSRGYVYTEEPFDVTRLTGLIVSLHDDLIYSTDKTIQFESLIHDLYKYELTVQRNAALQNSIDTVKTSLKTLVNAKKSLDTTTATIRLQELLYDLKVQAFSFHPLTYKFQVTSGSSMDSIIKGFSKVAKYHSVFCQGPLLKYIAGTIGSDITAVSFTCKGPTIFGTRYMLTCHCSESIDYRLTQYLLGFTKGQNKFSFDLYTEEFPVNIENVLFLEDSKYASYFTSHGSRVFFARTVFDAETILATCGITCIVSDIPIGSVKKFTNDEIRQSLL